MLSQCFLIHSIQFNPWTFSMFQVQNHSFPFFCNPNKTLYLSNRNTTFHKNTFSFYLTSSTKTLNNVLLNKLKNWVDQYKKDIDFRGIGYAPIFTVYQDLFGGVKRVLVDEDEILKRFWVQRGGMEWEDGEKGKRVKIKSENVKHFLSIWSVYTWTTVNIVCHYPERQDLMEELIWSTFIKFNDLWAISKNSRIKLTTLYKFIDKLTYSLNIQ